MEEPGDRDRDHARLMALLEPVHERARQTARRLSRSESEGDDLFQDAAVRAMDKLHALRDDQAFAAWFYRIMLSLHRTRMRSHFWRRLSPLSALAGRAEEPVGDDGSAWHEEREGARRMREALATLPAEQREAIVLFELDGYSLEEVARYQDASIPAVKSRLSRGRKRLRRYYERRGFHRGHLVPDDAEGEPVFSTRASVYRSSERSAT